MPNILHRVGIAAEPARNPRSLDYRRRYPSLVVLRAPKAMRRKAAPSSSAAIAWRWPTPIRAW